MSMNSSNENVHQGHLCKGGEVFLSIWWTTEGSCGNVVVVGKIFWEITMRNFCQAVISQNALRQTDLLLDLVAASYVVNGVLGTVHYFVELKGCAGAKKQVSYSWDPEMYWGQCWEQIWQPIAIKHLYLANSAPGLWDGTIKRAASLLVMFLNHGSRDPSYILRMENSKVPCSAGGKHWSRQAGSTGWCLLSLQITVWSGLLGSPVHLVLIPMCEEIKRLGVLPGVVIQSNRSSYFVYVNWIHLINLQWKLQRGPNSLPAAIEILINIITAENINILTDPIWHNIYMSLTLGHLRRAFDTGHSRQNDQLKHLFNQQYLIYLFITSVFWVKACVGIVCCRFLFFTKMLLW